MSLTEKQDSSCLRSSSPNPKLCGSPWCVTVTSLRKLLRRTCAVCCGTHSHQQSWGDNSNIQLSAGKRVSNVLSSRFAHRLCQFSTSHETVDTCIQLSVYRLLGKHSGHQNQVKLLSVWGNTYLFEIHTPHKILWRYEEEPAQVTTILTRQVLCRMAVHAVFQRFTGFGYTVCIKMVWIWTEFCYFA